MKLVKLRQKGQWELKNLLLSLNVEYGSKKLRSASMEWLLCLINEFEDYFLEC